MATTRWQPPSVSSPSRKDVGYAERWLDTGKARASGKSVMAVGQNQYDTMEKGAGALCEGTQLLA